MHHYIIISNSIDFLSSSAQHKIHNLNQIFILPRGEGQFVDVLFKCFDLLHNKIIFIDILKKSYVFLEVINLQLITFIDFPTKLISCLVQFMDFLFNAIALLLKFIGIFIHVLILFRFIDFPVQPFKFNDLL